MMANGYEIQCKSISSIKPPANIIVEKVQQTIGNIISSFKLKDLDLEDENPWERILL